MAVYDNVAKALDQAGVAYKGEDTLRGKIALWLSDESKKRFFSELLLKAEYRGLLGIQGKTVDDIITQLKGSDNADTLVDSLTTIAEKEGVTAFRISENDLTSWLSDVISTNGLKAIVFIWDEFSSYFKQNKNNLDVMQKLTEFSSEAPFYFMIVTYVSGSLVDQDSNEAYKVISDRFIHKSIVLPDSITFELIAHAFKVKDAAKEEWSKISEDLNAIYISSVRDAVSKSLHIDPSILSKLLPIHPMAALLLKNISELFASNQRSMFNFIKNNTPDVKAFQWFIENHSPLNYDFLTIDHLWDFFYEKGGDEHGIGRQNLDSMVSQILSTYQTSESMLQSNDEKMVLKTILMMQAISLKTKDGQKLFLPHRKNLNFAFEGTKLVNGYGITIAESLVKRGILFEKPNGDTTTFAAAAMTGDQNSIDALKVKLKAETRTVTLVESADFKSVLTLTPGQAARFITHVTTVDNFTRTIKGILNASRNYHIVSVLCFARNEEEQGKFKTLLKDTLGNKEFYFVSFIDFTSSLMGLDEYDQWIENSANEIYWREKDKTVSDEMKLRATQYLMDWKNKITEASCVYHPALSEENLTRFPESCLKRKNLSAALSQNTLDLYPFSFDNADIAESLFTGHVAANQGAKFGLEQQSGGRFNATQITNMLQDVWQKENETYWTLYPSLPISKLKVKIDTYISDTLTAEMRVSVGDIFDKMIEYGFMPCNLYAFLAGFLLKEYGISKYRYVIGEDGDTGGVMTTDDLSSFIGEYLKHKNTAIKGYKPKYIAVMTQNQHAFIQFAQQVFQIEECASLEQSVNKVRTNMTRLGYPIWCYHFVDTNQMSDYLDKLADIMNLTNNSVSTIAEELGDMLCKNTSALETLKLLLTPERGANAVECFVKNYESGILFSLADEIKIETTDLLQKVREKITTGHGAWL